MRSLAASQRYFFEDPEFPWLWKIFEAIAADTVLTDMSEIVIREPLANRMRLVPGSWNRVPDQTEPSPRVLTWPLRDPPASGLTVTYRARPQSPGYLRVSLGATCVVTDAIGRRQTCAFPIPRLTVLQPEVHSTPTARVP
jgi:hypothetical protein